MQLSTLIAAASIASTAIALPSTSNIGKRSVDQNLFDEFLRAIKISQAAYTTDCAKPIGLEKKLTIADTATSCDGFVLRDDERKEIIVAFQGTNGIIDVVIDLQNTLVDWTSPGSGECSGCQVHEGFQRQWNSVSDDVLAHLESEVSKYPDYNITVTGHSLGGALTILAGTSIEKTFPGKVTGYGFASPRVGNPAFASFVDTTFGNRMYRVTHTDDNVPQDLTQDEGYRHVSTEYWISDDPATAENIVKCQGGEDPECNMAHGEPDTGLGGINEAHMVYIINMRDDPECS